MGYPYIPTTEIFSISINLRVSVLLWVNMLCLSLLDGLYAKVTFAIPLKTYLAKTIFGQTC
jgi:hypothetical protein